MNQTRITALGDSGLILELGSAVDELTHSRVQTAVRLLESPPLEGVTEVVPAFTTVTLFYNPLALVQPGEPSASTFSRLAQSVRSRLRKLPAKIKPDAGRIVEIPICYGGPFGPDLEEVAARTGLAPEEVARRHSNALYLVFLIGFSPGFPYLGGLPDSLSLPRRSTPRGSVPAGSVGITNSQCCIYPMPTPGGWNLIGRTPLRLFDVNNDPPSLLRAGDRVKFRAVTPDEFGRGTATP